MVSKGRLFAFIGALLLILMGVSPVFALEGTGHMKLLAVTESSKGLSGSIADLSLEVRPGQGRVFLETFPPTKEDTQISMRFAKQVACAELELDCADKDFVYTIRAGPGIVGGPSAGASAALLTMSLLSGTPLRDDVALTGTVNSGGIIGPVGGLKSKIKAASQNGVKLALIPLGTRISKQRLEVSIERPEAAKNGSAAIADGSSNSSADEDDQSVEGDDGDMDIDADVGDGPAGPKDEPVPLVIGNLSIPANGSINLTKRVVKDLDLVKYGKGLGVDVREVSTVSDALAAFTGKNLSKGVPAFTIAPDYVKIMGNISSSICARSRELEGEFAVLNRSSPQPARMPVELVVKAVIDIANGSLANVSGSDSSNRSGKAGNSSGKTGLEEGLDEWRVLNESERFMRLAKEADGRGDHYSAASYCFRSNINLGALVLLRKNLSNDEFGLQIDDLERRIEALRTKVQTRRASTITDIQTSMVVQERLDESKRLLQDLSKEQKGSRSTAFLAYAMERFHSAQAWSRFFEAAGSSYNVDESSLRQSCQDKIMEAQERYQYVVYYLPNALAGVQKEVEKAAAFSRDGNFQRCLHIASLAKAEANLVGSLIGANRGSLPGLLDQKLSAVKRSIARTQKDGGFPIIAYSYFEYSNSLRGSDMNSALLFAEYALELSNLDMYFARKPVQPAASPSSSKADLVTGQAVRTPVASSAQDSVWAYPKSFFSGFVVGVVMMLVIAVLARSPGSDEPRLRRGNKD